MPPHLFLFEHQVIELSSLQKDNTVLKGDVAAHQSVIEGLRSERELWSRELSEQVSSINFTMSKGTNCIHSHTRSHLLLTILKKLKGCLQTIPKCILRGGGGGGGGGVQS